ncbi:MAG: THUMP domain-containing protein [Methanobacterium sp.]
MNYDRIIVRYGEIGVKSPSVRRRFENKLIENIKPKINCKIKINQGRIFLFPVKFDEALNELKKIIGVVSFSPVVSTETSFNSIEQKINEYIDSLISEDLFDPEKTFAIRCRRVGKHEFSSQEMAGFCGSVVVKNTDAPVNLSNPDFVLFIEVRDNKTYISMKKYLELVVFLLERRGK